MFALLAHRLSAHGQTPVAPGPANDWVTSKILGSPAGPYDAQPFFSFSYGGKPSAGFLASWKVERTTTRLDANRERIVVTYFDPNPGLIVRCEAVRYLDFPTVEWTLYFKNADAADSPVISEILVLDTRFANGMRPFPPFPVVHYNDGGYQGPNAFQPHEAVVSDERDPLRFNPGSGRGSDQWLPYFNVETGDGGVIVAIGWPGQWKAAFHRNGQVKAGQELTHFVLHAGEEVRTPLIALQFWSEGGWTDAQNVWRRWMLAHNSPAADGKILPPLFNACSSHQFGEMIHANEANQIEFIDGYAEAGVKLDHWWMDAGWYSKDGEWKHTGTWEVDTARFPRGLRAVSDHAHAGGVKVITWFEPERVWKGTWLWTAHPDWLLGQDAPERLLNLGHPEARKWAVDHFSKFITDQGIDLYRQDFNIAPLAFWREADPADRQGITEIRYVEGYLAYWDALRAAHPGMLLDSCASGGRRIDLESVRRAVTLTRNDCLFEPRGQQGQSYGLASWIPYQGTGQISLDPYRFRSCMAWSNTACYDVRKKEDFPALKKMVDQWRRVAGFFTADYYPLTPYSLSGDAWMGWQYNRPEEKSGVIQVFRHHVAAAASNRFRVRGLDAAANYAVTDIDTGQSQKLTGKQLMDDGFLATVPTQPGAGPFSLPARD